MKDEDMKKTFVSVLMLTVACISFTPHVQARVSFEATPASVMVQDISAAQANDQIGKGAQNFIDGMGQRAIGFLGNSSLSISQKQSEFRKLLRSSFDMKTIGRFALGRNWNVATPDQQREYQMLFEDMVVDVYSNRFNDYKGQKFDVQSFRRDGDKDTMVTSYIVPDAGEKIQVDWRVRYKDSTYKIVDVIIEGVSMSVTQRSDFASVIQRGGGSIQVLLSHLREKRQ
ncbi:MAG: ABC transporter substrate-binding protein [Alphaproteobacteria bacterium]|nr:ABC transporter substrate-binding protein [Alphaproteobacteria bacterium]